MKKWLSCTLTEMIQQYPVAACVFEKYGILYQEKGEMKLTSACDEKKVDKAHMVRDLTYRIHHISEADDSIDFEAMPLDTLCDYIQTRHHDYIKEEVPKILARLSKLTYRYHDLMPHLMQVQNAFQQISHHLVMHLYKEEHILFPAIKKIVQHKRENNQNDLKESFVIIRASFHAHQNETNLMEDIKQLTNNYTPIVKKDFLCNATYKQLKSFAYDLHWHEHIENNVLLPRSLNLESEMIDSAERFASPVTTESAYALSNQKLL